MDNQVEQISDLYHYIFNAKHRVALSILFLFSLLSKTMYCQDMVRGVVTEKGTNVPVAGAIVTIKGTVSVAQTGADGSFSIQAGKAGDTLIIQSVGYYIREIVVRGTAPLLITLKLFCNIDYFDNQLISFGIQSGVKNTPAGGYLGVSLPYFRTVGTAWTRAEYQSGKATYFLRLEAGYDHMISECDFRFDLKAGYTKVSKGTSVGAIIYTAGGTAHLYRTVPGIRYFTIYAGAGLLYFNERNQSRWRKYMGPSIGLGTEIFERNKIKLNGQLLMIRHHPEVQLQAERPIYYRLRVFMRYYQLNSFKEITAGAGWSFYYRIKSK